MKNLEIWVITFVIAVLLLVGVFYYGILETVANAGAFIISLTIILLALILLIIFSQKDYERKQEIFNRSSRKSNERKQHLGSKEVSSGRKPKNAVKKTSSKKQKIIKKK